jgi:hypothetical protein
LADWKTNRKTQKKFRLPYRPLYPDSLRDSHYELLDKDWVESTPHPHVGTPTIYQLNAYRKKKGLRPLTLEEVRMQSREIRLQFIRELLRKKDYDEAYWQVANNVLWEYGGREPTHKQIVAILEEQMAKLDETKKSDKENERYLIHAYSGKRDRSIDE